MHARTLLSTTLLLSTALLSIACSAAPDDETTAAADDALQPNQQSGRFDRIVWGRLYINEQRFESPAEVADHLARFCPSYVAGLVRINPADYFSTVDPSALAQQIDDYDQVRKTIRAANPRTMFDVHLSASVYETWEGGPKALKPVLETVKDRFRPDVVFFDFFVCDEGGALCSTKKDVMRHAIAWGQCKLPEQAGTGCKKTLIGGNFLDDPSSSGPEAHGTADADFFAAVDSGSLTLDGSKLETMHERYGKPVLMHINNNPQNSPRGASCTFMNLDHDAADYDWSQRARYEQKRATSQHDMPAGRDRRYHYMYNVFFPACVPHPWDVCCDPNVNLTSHPECKPKGSCVEHQVQYDATKDEHGGKTMAQVMRQLAIAENPLEHLPSTCLPED